jgi:protoheme IX farnesyltransferase
VSKPAPRQVRDFLSMTKPGIVRMCLVMAAGGLWLAGRTQPGHLASRDPLVWVSALVGTALIVAAANTFNMVWERHTDRMMPRTRNRPVAAGRVGAPAALAFAGMLTALALIVFVLGTNPLTAVLGLGALLGYVLVYTPLKRVSPLALIVGALPGAMPPLLGWTAITGELDLPGFVLFAILMVWQMPHFIAIALYRKREYADAGIRTVPVVRGDRVATAQAIVWSALLIPVSLALTPLGVTGGIYLVVAGALGLVFFAWSLTGLRYVGAAPEAPPEAGSSAQTIAWARRFFLVSLLYLPALTAGLVLDLLL